MQRLDKQSIVILSALFAALMIGLSIWGAHQSYTVVPYWDMWEAVDFFLKADKGETAVWWNQHNEHRIVLTRLLVWAVLKWFGGSSIFLIGLNYLFAGLASLLFWRILRATTQTERPSTGEVCFGFMITASLFLWSQYDNLTVPFQSQFFLVSLLPLFALYLLHKATGITRSYSYFFIACIFGFASILTMANGVFILPLMVLYAITTRQSKARVFGLIILTGFSLALYLHNYHRPIGHGSIQEAIIHNPLRLFVYVLSYLGSPFYFLFKSKLITWLLGFVFLCCSMIATVQLLPKRAKASLKLVLLFFIFYIEITAFCTGGGRVLFGVTQALTSRYTTPALMAWVALLILYIPSILATMRNRYKKQRALVYCILIFVTAVLMLRLQSEALIVPPELFDREVAALALGLGVNDSEQIKQIYPGSERALALAKEASIKNISVFGVYPFREMRQLGNTVPQSALPTCLAGNIKHVARVADKRFVWVNGWLRPSKAKSRMIRFLNNKNQVVGYALIEKKTTKKLYEGYILRDQLNKGLRLQGDDFTCQMDVDVAILNLGEGVL
ncbi:MAG: hypothetical protein QNK11_08425 [Legionella sp.]|nr:hypothetical protein [Legionella sp.]